MATKKCMKCGGSMNKYAKGGQALNKAKGFAKAQSGGSNVSNKIYGVPNAGSTGPNMQGIDTMKKGGATKSKKDLPKAKFGSSVPVQHSPAPGRVRSSSGVGTVPVGARKKKGGAVKKYASGGSTFPDLTGDNKVTRADILKGRGVIKQLGGPSGFTSPGALIMEADKKARSKYYTEDNIRKSGSKLSDKEAEKNIQANKTKLYNQYMKDANLSPSKKSKAKKSSTKKG